MTTISLDDLPKRTYRSTFPLPRSEGAAMAITAPWPLPEGHEELLVFLQWEGFVKQAELENLELISFTDCGELEPEKIRQDTVEQIGWPAKDFIWRHFEGVAQRPEIVEWCKAEGLYEAQTIALQEADQLAAEEGELDASSVRSPE